MTTPKTIEVPEELLREAKELIGYIGTTGTERTDVIRRADAWLACIDRPVDLTGGWIEVSNQRPKAPCELYNGTATWLAKTWDEVDISYCATHWKPYDTQYKPSPPPLSAALKPQTTCGE